MTTESLYSPRIALVGNPNCGKTALFNALTGSRQKVANYAGVTVEKKEGIYVSPEGHKFRVVDLPGTYSLRARSPDEEVTRDVVLGKFAKESPPDAIVCVADATNLHLGLRLVLELKKVGRPIVLALNMMDIARKRGYAVDVELLSKEIDAPVIPIVATKNNGIEELVVAIEKEYFKSNKQNQSLTYNNETSNVLPFQTKLEWNEPSSQDVRAYHKEVERILCVANRRQGTASGVTNFLDSVFLHPFFGLFFLFSILFLVFQCVFTLSAYPQQIIETLIENLQKSITLLLPDGALRSLLSDGIIAGVGSVLVFLPQIVSLFFFLILLEDSGYMARAAFLMDKLMGAVGLHGRAFIPLFSSFGCAIPGIMAARTIESKRDRIITILISPLMTCSARLPVYTLIIAAFIPQKFIFGFVSLQGLVMFGLYIVGIFSGLAVAFILKKFVIKGQIFPLLMELPTYKWPSLRNLFYGLWNRAKMFLVRAGTLILSLMVVIWFLSTYPKAPLGATLPDIEYSFAGMLGKFIEPVLAPIGFNWQIAIALIPGMAAREVAVATLGTVYAISGSEDAVSEGLAVALTSAWTLPTALAFLTWYIFAPQCAPTLAVAKRETNSWVWPLVMFSYMFALAYGFSFVVYQVLSMIL